MISYDQIQVAATVAQRLKSSGQQVSQSRRLVCVCVYIYRYSKRFSFDESLMFRYIASKQSLVPGDLSPHLSSSLGSFQARYAFCQVCFLGFRLRL